MEDQYEELHQMIQEQDFDARDEQDRMTIELTEVRELARYKQEELEASIKEKDEEIKSIKTNVDKERAIWKQKVEFKDV